MPEGIDYSILDAKNPEDLTEEEKIALLGRPCLGNNTKLQIRIRESKEFKVKDWLRIKSVFNVFSCRALWTSWWRRLTTAWWSAAPPGWSSSLLLSRFRPVSKVIMEDHLITELSVSMENDYYYEYYYLLFIIIIIL